MYAVASLCYLTGRLDDGIRYTDAARVVLADRRDVLPSIFDGMIGGAYTYIGNPERWKRVRECALESCDSHGRGQRRLGQAHERIYACG
jgi:hypothetical protein